MTFDDARSKKPEPFARTFYACLCMGFFYCWINLSGTTESTVFGTPFVGSTYTMGVHNSLIRISIGLSFLAFSFPFARRLFSDTQKAIVISGVLGLLGTVTCWCSTLFGSFPLILGGIVSGAALALFTTLWLIQYRHDHGGLFTMLLLAAGVSGLFLPCIAYFGGIAPYIASVLLPIAAAALLLRASKESPIVNGGEAPSGPAPRTAHVAVQSAVLLLCNFASGPAAYGMLATMGDSTLQVSSSLSLILVAVLGLCKIPRDEVMLAFGSFSICLCIAPVLISDQTPPWLPALTSSIFWVITKYSIAWFAVNGGSAQKGLSPMGLRGLSAVYLLTAISEMIGMQVSHLAACAIALLAVGLALAVALVNATQSAGVETLNTSRLDEHVDILQRCHSPNPSAIESLSEQASLTEGEQRVFEYLSRGYSLKEIARQLNLTEGGAKYHRHNIYQKLGVTSRQELINLVESVGTEPLKKVGVPSTGGD